MDGAAVKTPVFRTPARILIPKMVKSRDGWKAKADERKKRLKAACIRNRDLEASRERWKDRCRDAESKSAEAAEQLEQMRQDLARARADADRLAGELEKK